MSTMWQNIQSKMLKSGSKLYLLIGINVVVFLVMLLAMSFANVNYFIVNNLLLPASLPRLATHFWTPFTYAFIHSNSIFQVIFNMLWLYWMGQLFEDYLGKKRTVGLYILGGLAGAAVYILCYNLIPAFSAGLTIGAIAGAPAAVMAIVVATTTLLPEQEVMLLFFPIKLKWLIFIYLGLILLSVLSNGGLTTGDYIAQLGGALFGFIYIKQLQKGRDMVGAISGLFTRGPKLSKLKVVARSNTKKVNTRPRQDEVDLILDKISKIGYENLSSDEKEILFRASKNES